jgi:hypothetical protein
MTNYSISSTSFVKGPQKGYILHHFLRRMGLTNGCISSSSQPPLVVNLDEIERYIKILVTGEICIRLLLNSLTPKLLNPLPNPLPAMGILGYCEILETAQLTK